MVTVKAIPGNIVEADVDTIVVNLFEGVTTPGGGTGAVDKALDGAISSLIEDGDIKGKVSEVTRIHTFGKLTAKRVVVLGLGKVDQFSVDVVRRVSGDLARYLRRIGAKRAATLAHGAGIGGLAPDVSGQAIAEGTILGLYRFRNYRKQDDDADKELEELHVVEQEQSKLDALNAGIGVGQALAESTIISRNLVNEPANVMTPIRMAEIAQEVATEVGLEYKALIREDMIQKGMGAILAVTAGSAQEPRLIILEYKGDPGHPDNNVALVGKGITFDTGGISLKPSPNMWEMKGDMAGGASVIGAMRAIAMLKPKMNVFGVVPAVENMPSGTAQRPGDIIRAMNGKSIEVDNTDAEGRLVLADAICYAKEDLNAKRVVDIATLTGAMVTALGHVATGVMGKSQSMVDAVLQASKATGEKMWQLPMFDEYREQIKSDWADVKNTGVRGAGSITAAFFISEFAEGVDWAHLDIAGTFLSDKDKGHLVKGASGIPVRTLVKLAQDLAEAK